MDRKPANSIRGHLQSASLLAVIAGYLVLLGYNHVVSNTQRQQVHLQNASQLKNELQLAFSRGELDSRLRQLWVPGFQIIKRPISSKLPSAARRALDGDGTQWLETGFTISTANRPVHSILLREDVTASVERERVSQMFLIVAACVSCLITSALLRPVLYRGLVKPLEQLSIQLDATHTPPFGGVHLSVDEQPKEFIPIAISFNELQDRLSSSWSRERSFVDGVAHELRTPITLISGHAQSLLKQQFPKEQKRSILSIQDEAVRMGNLVSDMLALARQEAGRLNLSLSYLDPQEQLLVAYERFQPSAKGRLVLGDLGFESDAVSIAADADRLQQCLAALVQNALNYSPDGSSVVLNLSFDRGYTLFHVVDSGPGVAQHEKDLIFERFFRGAASHGVRGSGIGLAVVRQLMTEMKGFVDVVGFDCGGADFRLGFLSCEKS